MIGSGFRVCDVIVRVPVVWFTGVMWGGVCMFDVIVCVPTVWFVTGVMWGGVCVFDVIVCVPMVWFVTGVKCGGDCFFAVPDVCTVFFVAGAWSGAMNPSCCDLWLDSLPSGIIIGSFPADLRSTRIIWILSCCTDCCSFEEKKKEKNLGLAYLKAERQYSLL